MLHLPQAGARLEKGPLPPLPGLPGPAETAPERWPGPHQLVFDEVTDDFVVEVLDGGPANALLHILLLGASKVAKNAHPTRVDEGGVVGVPFICPSHHLGLFSVMKQCRAARKCHP